MLINTCCASFLLAALFARRFLPIWYCFLICLTRCLLRRIRIFGIILFAKAQLLLAVSCLIFLMLQFILCGQPGFGGIRLIRSPFRFLRRTGNRLIRQFLFFKTAGVWFYSSSDRTPF